jgi:hypothetical protein
LQGADLTGANLSHANLEGAQYDSLTIFPEGFCVPQNMIYQEDGENDHEFRHRANEIKTQYPIDHGFPLIHDSKSESSGDEAES